MADDLERLRIERGEGWEWNRIQAEACPQCGDNPAALPVESLGPLAVARATAWREFLEHADDAYLRRVPEPGVFSPLQYAAHVRDIVRVYTDRVELGLEHDAPTVSMFHLPQDVWEEYNRSMFARSLQIWLRKHSAWNTPLRRWLHPLGHASW